MQNFLYIKGRNFSVINNFIRALGVKQEEMVLTLVKIHGPDWEISQMEIIQIKSELPFGKIMNKTAPSELFYSQKYH